MTYLVRCLYREGGDEDRLASARTTSGTCCSGCRGPSSARHCSTTPRDARSAGGRDRRGVAGRGRSVHRVEPYCRAGLFRTVEITRLKVMTPPYRRELLERELAREESSVATPRGRDNGERLDLPQRAGCFRQRMPIFPRGRSSAKSDARDFGGQATHLYHRHPPTSWVAWDGPHRPRASTSSGSRRRAPVRRDDGGRIERKLKLRLWKTQGAMRHLFRNADGDDLLFVHAGTGEFYCDYGHLRLVTGDYVVVRAGRSGASTRTSRPRCCCSRRPATAIGCPTAACWRSRAVRYGGARRPRVDEAFVAQQDEEPWTIRIQARGRLSAVHFPHNPLDAIGWKGTLLPMRLNWRDIRPINSHRYHLPPSAHTTFGRTASPSARSVRARRRRHRRAEGALLPFERRLRRTPVPACGRVLQPQRHGPGSLTFHPAGVPHGPHPGAYQARLDHPRQHLQEVAINIDSRDPLDIAAGMAGRTTRTRRFVAPARLVAERRRCDWRPRRRLARRRADRRQR